MSSRHIFTLQGSHLGLPDKLDQKMNIQSVSTNQGSRLAEYYFSIFNVFDLHKIIVDFLLEGSKNNVPRILIVYNWFDSVYFVWRTVFLLEHLS